MKHQEYIELLFKQLEGSISPEEATDLDDWLSQEASHQKVAEKVKSLWNQMSQAGSSKELDLEADFQRVKERITLSTAGQKAGWRWRSWKTAALILVLLSSSLFLFRELLFQPSSVKLVGPIEAHLLPDQSKIWLASGSRATYAPDADHRIISLEGTAYLEVRYQDDTIFEVVSNAGSVKVIGTAFEVVTESEPPLQVRVFEGQVRLVNAAKTDSVDIIKGASPY